MRLLRRRRGGFYYCLGALQLPRHAAERPDQAAIAQRYEDFRTAAG